MRRATTHAPVMRFPLTWLYFLLPLFVVFAPQLPAEAPANPFAKWEKEISAFEE
jgi:hypothetical protein